ncbi:MULTISPECIES: bifunctional oligoribonuclease/PAP phosphatase NrnA [Halobacterium]|uniref:DHH family phosphoesterase n=1 Tax=Halobacterium TaxID=2239 RepID=UPI00073F3266|nr:MULTISPECIES: bifunctional oligoribonuclease/PAP phosphatase NrnA [Halobacterium]MCG1002423.1 bifunctional oligoribonuclease/PAP phosphatase NrnA [Halobacterium noricense]
MVSRLVLGCGTTGHALVEDLSQRRGELFVLDGDASRVESLRNEKVAAEVRDITDPVEISGLERDVDVVVVASDGAAANRLAAEAAREVYPDAELVAYLGFEATSADREALAAVADRVVDPGAAVLDRVEEAATADDAEKLQALRSTLEGIDGTLGVFMHDNPDPDAIATAIGLSRIANEFGVETEPCYFGEISHQENRAFVNLLDLEVRNVTVEEELDFDAVALVDHSAPGVNDQLDPDTNVDIVVDHHPPGDDVDADFVDIRPGLGAASTILVEYVRGFDLDIETAVATALLYGIRVDTDDFAREITTDDFEAGAWLLDRADTDVLERIESPSVSADTLDTIARAIRDRELDGSVLSSCVGAIADRDTLAQAADRLLAMRGVTVTFVYGYTEGTIYVSARARGNDVDLGAVLRSAFGDMGSAGGHADMAGAQLPLGLFDQVGEDAEQTLTEMVEDVVATRFFEEIRGG